jgi:hypothetical protein
VEKYFIPQQQGTDWLYYVLQLADFPRYPVPGFPPVAERLAAAQTFKNVAILTHFRCILLQILKRIPNKKL